jgi:hypothetical protein
LKVKVVGFLALILVSVTAGFAQSPVSLQSLQPSAVPAGAGATTVTLIGSGFTSSLVVTVRNVANTRFQTFTAPVLIDSSTMQITIPASFFATPDALVITAGPPGPSAPWQFFYIYSPTPPALTSISPAGAPAGTTFVLRISGTDLTGATPTLSGSGISVVPLTQPDQQSTTPATSWLFGATIAPDAAPGTQAVTISTPSGSTTNCGARPCTLSVVQPGVWTPAPPTSLSIPTTVVHLLDNRILVVGLTSAADNTTIPAAQIFDPLLNQWMDTAASGIPRRQNTGAVLLPDGRVFLSSSDSLMAEIYDPAAGTWTTTSPMSATPAGLPILLPNGRVLVQHSASSTGAEQFDPGSGVFQPVSMPTGTMQLMSNRKVFVVNGDKNQVYDPATGTSTAVATLPLWPQLGFFPSCCITRVLPDGRVLVQYGFTLAIHDARITNSYAVTYDQQTNSIVPETLNIGGGSPYRGAVLLPSGKLFVSEALPKIAGPVVYQTIPSAVLYDPQTDQVFLEPTTNPPFTPDVLLDDGRTFGISNLTQTEFRGVFAGFHNPVPEFTPPPVIGSISLMPAAVAGTFGLDIRGTSFVPNSIVRLGESRLVTIYLGSQRLIAFVPQPLSADLSPGITISNASPGGGTTAATPVGFVQTLPIPDVETGTIRTGYAIVTPDTGTPAPVSTLTYGIVHNAIVESQAAILPTPLTTGTSLPVDYVQSIGRNIGVAIANPNGGAAAITLTLRDEQGASASSVTLTIPAGNQIARFVSELFPADAVGNAFTGSLSIQSSVAVSIVGLRFSGQEFSTVPITVSGTSNVPQQGPVGGANATMFPQFAMSGGWATTVGMVNTASTPISGRLDLFDPSGKPLVVRLNDVTASTFTYSIPAHGSVTFAPRDAGGLSPF